MTTFAMFVGSPLFFILCFGIGPAVWIAISFSGRETGKRDAQLMQTGARGQGTIVNIADTGVTVNMDPRVHVTARVRPADGTPVFQLQQTILVSRLAIPRVGDEIAVWYDRNDPSKWTWQPLVATT